MYMRVAGPRSHAPIISILFFFLFFADTLAHSTINDIDNYSDKIIVLCMPNGMSDVTFSYSTRTATRAHNDTKHESFD